MNIVNCVIIFLILASFLIGAYLYPVFPDTVASHWNMRGEVDGYMSKFWGLFLMPIILLIAYLLFLLIPKIDPLKKNIEKFRGYFDSFILVFVLFMFYIYFLTLFWNVGHVFDMNVVLMPAFAFLLYCCGILIEKAKRNYFIGIRTPWTLANDKVWDKTHQVGGLFFKMTAISTLFGTIYPEYAFWFLFVPITFTIVFVFVYSYLEYKRLGS